MIVFQLSVSLRVVWHHPHLLDAILLIERTNYVIDVPLKVVWRRPKLLDVTLLTDIINYVVNV